MSTLTAQSFADCAKRWASSLSEDILISSENTRCEEDILIQERIRESVHPGTVIPKPEANADFVVKAWGTRRGETALVYFIPNHGSPGRPHQKGVTVSEFESAFRELERSGEFTRAWFNKHLANCAKEGACNYTTIGGVFELLGEARYSKRGVYER